MSTNLEQYIYNVLEIYSVSFCTSMVKGSAFFLLKKEGKITFLDSTSRSIPHC